LPFSTKVTKPSFFAPYWVSYYPIIKLSGATPVVLSAGVEQDYKVTASQLEHAINEKTRLVIFSSPCNPTGSVYHKEELAALVAVLEKNKHVFIVSDEIYEYINFTDTHISIGSFEAVKDRTITVNGFSKGFAMTGWRLGYMGAPLAIAKACTKLQGQFTSGANSFSQLAGAYALESDLGPSMKMKEAFLERRDMVLNLLRDIPGVKTNIPEGAFYIFPDMSAYFGKKSQDGQLIKDSDVLSEYLLRDALVALVSGSAFGAPECIRISYAASEEELREAVKRIKTSLEKLS
jgi:aspartate aminotransferase